MITGHGGTIQVEVRMRQWHRRARLAVVAAMVVATTGIVALTSSASTTFSFKRLAGVDRYETARVIAEATFPTSPSVVLASGDNKHAADAVAGSYVAGVGHYAMLLTAINALPGPTLTALQNLKARSVLILGGTSAVSTAVENDLRNRGFFVARIAGTDRYDTADKQAESGGKNVGTFNGKKTAIVVSGEDNHLADALSGSPMAYADHFPTFLTTGASLSPAAAHGLGALGIKHAIVLGGTAAVSNNVIADIETMGITTQRIDGSDRTDTAANVASFELTSLGFKKSHVNLARGDLFPDALVGGVHAGQEDPTPVLLTLDPNTLGPSTESWLSSHAQQLADGHIFGGDAAVTPATQAAAEASVKSNSLPNCGPTTTSSTTAAPSTTQCFTTTTAAPTTSTTAPPDTTTTLSSAAVHFTSANGQNGTTFINVVYNTFLDCSTVDANGSDYTVIKESGSVNVPVTAAECTVASQTVTLTINQNVAAATKYKITAKAGADTNTVKNFQGDAQPVGDFTGFKNP
jgi:putative cell wall-binding protein